jgi:uncharacterized oxidoreductase
LPTFAESELLDLSTRLLIAGGATAAEAPVVAASLVGANLRGHDSHGVMRIPFYLDALKRGAVQPGRTLSTERETPAAVVCDGGWGFGQVLARDLLRRVMDKADAVGIACGTLRRSAHIGRLGEYAEIAAEQNRASLICANTHGAAPRVAPVGGKRPRLGTNPICIGVPGGKDGPFIFDIGTSATAEGKVRVKRIAGLPVPHGWILDPEGRPTTDPNQLYGDPPGTILPLGGDQAYKGFGLAFMIELLAGGLSGGECAHPNPPPPVGNCAVFLVWAPDRLGGTDHLLREALGVEAWVREVPRIEGIERIMLPGDPERRTLEERRSRGIPIDEGNWGALVKLADALGVSVPSG